MIDSILMAVLRCRAFALSVFLTYVLSSSVGIFMVHAGNRFALAQRAWTHRSFLAAPGIPELLVGERAGTVMAGQKVAWVPEPLSLTDSPSYGIAYEAPSVTIHPDLTTH